MPFKLSASLVAHSGDVRAVASPRDDLVLSASRDSSAIAWIKSNPNSFAPTFTYRAGPRYINSVTYLPPTSEAPQGYIVTGGQDAIINIWAIGSDAEPRYTLLGHTENVCALRGRSDGTIISGSWDRTAKVWKNFQLAYDLKGHEQSVWAVLDVDDDQYLTGAADKTIKLWKQHKCLRTYNGHKDAVRGLALITDIGFASASNDSEIVVWTFEGDVVHSLTGHTSFVYSLVVLPNGDMVSSGEDRTVRVWRDGECAQTIVHPAISVWSVSVQPNGDIVSGSSDGIVRIFSESEERWASAEDLKAYEDQVASQALPAQQVGDVKKADLPGSDALLNRGNKPGEVKMIRNGDIVEAHQWDAASGSWQKIGEVVDAVGSGRKQLHEGKEYDYVFDVDIQDGVPPLKLPYNVNENPFSAAQRFLERNELPLTYVDQVVQFIEKNTAGVNIGSNDEFVDPFTGASRYRGAGQAAQTSAGSDPFTGGSRYTPVSSPPPVVSSGDPFTGSSRYVSTPPAAQTPSPVASVIPVAKTLSFKQANVSAMQGKLYQFDDALRNEISTSGLALYPEEAKLFEEMFAYLSEAVAGRVPERPLKRPHIETVVQILTRWPAAQRFPVLDLARLISGFCADLLARSGMSGPFFDALFKASDWTSNLVTPMSKAQETNVLLALRTMVNAVQDRTQIGDGEWVKDTLARAAQTPYVALTKTQRLAVATLYFNLSCVSLHEPLDPGLRATYISLLLQVLTLEKNDSETAYRALVAAGNILHAARAKSNPVDATQAGALRAAVSALPTMFAEARIRSVGGEVLALL